MVLGTVIGMGNILWRLLVLNSWDSGRGAILEDYVRLGVGVETEELSH